MAVLDYLEASDADITLAFVQLSGRAAVVTVHGGQVTRRGPLPDHGPSDPDDPLVHQWVLAVLGPHAAALLVARQVRDPHREWAERYEFVLSHDRHIVDPLARMLSSQLADRLPPTKRG